MSVPEAFRLVVESTDLDPGVPKSFVIDTYGATTIGLVIGNAGGSNAIDTVLIEKSPLGNKYGPDTAYGTAIGSIAANTNALAQISAKGFTKVRVTLTSSSGTSYEIETKGVF